MLIRYTCVLQCDKHHSVARTSITSQRCHFFSVVRTFKVYPLGTFGECDTVLLSAVTRLCIDWNSRT